MNYRYEILMQLAIQQAKEAAGEVPIGCVIADEHGNVISYAHNLTITNNDPTAHAEIIAIQKACKKLKTNHLNGMQIITTLEPCPMCTGAIINAKIDKIVFGAFDDELGAISSRWEIVRQVRPLVQIQSGVLEEECSRLVTEYFKNLRTRDQ